MLTNDKVLEGLGQLVAKGMDGRLVQALQGMVTC